MRLAATLAIAVAFLCVAAPVFAEGDGGLHVCCGGSVGYVGGSGSISGHVRGPGGSSTHHVAPKTSVPNATTGGDTSPVVLLKRHVDAAPVKSHAPLWPGALLATILSMLVAVGVAYAFRRPIATA